MALRYDNADQRLSQKGFEIGLLGNDDWERFNLKRDRISFLRNTLINTKFKRSDIQYSIISQMLGINLGDSITLSQLAQRQGVNSELIFKFLPSEIQSKVNLNDLDITLADSLYEGYIKNQNNINERLNTSDNLKVPENFTTLSSIEGQYRGPIPFIFPEYRGD